MSFVENIEKGETHSCKTQNCYLLPDVHLTVHNLQPAISNEATESGSGLGFQIGRKPSNQSFDAQDLSRILVGFSLGMAHLSHNRTIMDANAHFVCILDVICSMSKKDKVVQKRWLPK